MQEDIFGAICFFGFTILIVFLIAHQVDLRLKIVGRFKCLFGKHDHGLKGKRKYRCQICAKAQPHLKAIQGGKKSVDVTFRF